MQILSAYHTYNHQTDLSFAEIVQEAEEDSLTFPEFMELFRPYSADVQSRFSLGKGIESIPIPNKRLFNSNAYKSRINGNPKNNIFRQRTDRSRGIESFGFKISWPNTFGHLAYCF